MDQHTGGKWLVHGIKHRKDNQLQSLELPCRIGEFVSRGGNIQRGAHLPNQNYLVSESLHE